MSKSTPVIRVYLDTPNLTGGVEIATFTDEKYYDVCWRPLEKLAEQEGYIITESLDELYDEDEDE